MLTGDLRDFFERVKDVPGNIAWQRDYILDALFGTTELKILLERALSDQLDDVTLLARGIDASYAYEGYAAYRTEEL